MLTSVLRKAIVFFFCLSSSIVSSQTHDTRRDASVYGKTSFFETVRLLKSAPFSGVINSSVVYGLDVGATSNAGMVDGFGPSLRFFVHRGGDRYLALIHAGLDASSEISGRLSFYVYDETVLSESLRLSSDLTVSLYGYDCSGNVGGGLLTADGDGLLSCDDRPTSGTMDHTALSNLAWTSSDHTGTADTVAGFDGTGAAAEYTTAGNTTSLATTTGVLTSGDCVEWDASGNAVASGAGCGGVTDHTGLSNLAWTSSAHTGTADTVAGFDGTGAAAEYTTAGNTTSLATTTGALTDGNCVELDASGNILDSGAACGSGTVTGTGSDDQVAVWTGASSQDGDTSLTYNSTTDMLTLDQATLPETDASTEGVLYTTRSATPARFLHAFRHPTGSSAQPLGYNIFLGHEAGNFTLGSTATSTSQASYNVGLGYTAGYALTTGSGNTLLGSQAGLALTSGGLNLLAGKDAGKALTTGYYNVALGYQAGDLWTTPTGMVAIGYNAGGGATGASGSYGVFIGYEAAAAATTAGLSFGQTAIGYQSLYSATNGNNTSVGYQSTLSTSGAYNTALGYRALYATGAISGSYNTAVGSTALGNATGGARGYNVAVGSAAGDGATTNTYSTFLGYSADTSATGLTYETAIGAGVTGNGSYTVTLGGSNIRDTYLRGTARIAISNATDEGVIIAAHASQSADLLVVEDSAGTDKLTINSAGNIVLPETDASTTGVVLTTRSAAQTRFLHAFRHPTGSSAQPEGYNVFLGHEAGNFTLGSTATSTSQATGNSIIGALAGVALTTGYHNSGLGRWSLNGVTEGYENSALGVSSGSLITTGYRNVTVGRTSGGTSLTTGNNSTYVGYAASASATGLTYETAIGSGVTGNGSYTVTLGGSNIRDTYLRGTARVAISNATDEGVIIAAHASQTADLLVVEDSAGTDFVTVTATGALDISGSSLGTCDSAARGQIRNVEGGTGVRDTLSMCLKSDSDTYSWVTVADGGA